MFASEPTAAHEASPFVFSPREIARLEIYRDAVRAGFYNETIHRKDIHQRVSTPAVLTETTSGCRDTDAPEAHR